MSASETSRPEFSRIADIRDAFERTLMLEPNPAERAALARRFEIIRIDQMTAEVTLKRESETVAADGTLKARIVQSCAVSGEDLTVTIDEPLHLRFVPPRTDHLPDEELELGAEDCDEIEFSGTSFDLGEAVAQSLGLAMDPFAAGPQAEAARRAAGLLDESESGPFAALKGLKLGGA